VFPFFSKPYVDRGSVLEDAWKREARLRRSDSAAHLASWRAGVSSHRCPGVVFNAMAAETGEPLLFSTLALPESLAAFSFYRHYPGRDVPITTAVRLSAAFPYVSAAARADVDGGTLQYTHIVDGGYFDNYGVSTMAAVSDAALRANALHPTPLLVIEICDAERCSGEPSPADPSVGGKRRAWPYQVTAPFAALLNMRSAAQRVADRTTLGLLVERWRSTVCIQTIHVPFGRGDAPMSWHLTKSEIDDIDNVWSALNASKHVTEAVSAYLNGRCSSKPAP
jgi:hypothetical protein